MPEQPVATVEGLMALVVKLTDAAFSHGCEQGALRDYIDRSSENAMESAILQYAERLACHSAPTLMPGYVQVPKDVAENWRAESQYLMGVIRASGFHRRTHAEDDIVAHIERICSGALCHLDLMRRSVDALMETDRACDYPLVEELEDAMSALRVNLGGKP